MIIMIVLPTMVICIITAIMKILAIRTVVLLLLMDDAKDDRAKTSVRLIRTVRVTINIFDG